MKNVNKWTEDELILTLGFYYLDKKASSNNKKIIEFTEKINKLTGNERSWQAVVFRIANFKSVDPNYKGKGLSRGGNRVLEMWSKYIGNDRNKEILKELYNDFKENKYTTLDSKKENLLHDQIYDEKFNNEIDSTISSPVVLTDIEAPKSKSAPVITNGRKIYKRDKLVSIGAIIKANYNCECNSKHLSFIRKSNGKNYTEAHHLIPMNSQDEFEYSLDVEANVISLCSTCHNKLHYGLDIIDVLRKLYDDRRERLKGVGIEISFTELVKHYK